MAGDNDTGTPGLAGPRDDAGGGGGSAVAAVDRSGGVAAPMSESGALLSMIERAARDPSVDIDKMERLFQMHERIEARRAIQSYNAAMATAQEEMPAVIKNKKNEHTKAKYADLFAIADECLPVIHKNGFGLSFSECKATEPNCMGIACRASHRDGHAENYTFNVPLDSAGAQGKVNKTATQAYGSTFTYGRRYATCGVFNIIITDKDGNAADDATGTNVVTDAQTAELTKLIKDSDADLAWILERYEITELKYMTAKQFAECKTGLTARLQNMKKAAANG